VAMDWACIPCKLQHGPEQEGLLNYCPAELYLFSKLYYAIDRGYMSAFSATAIETDNVSTDLLKNI